jgi:hypothetical protein
MDGTGEHSIPGTEASHRKSSTAGCPLHVKARTINSEAEWWLQRVEAGVGVIIL